MTNYDKFYIFLNSISDANNKNTLLSIIHSLQQQSTIAQYKMDPKQNKFLTKKEKKQAKMIQKNQKVDNKKIKEVNKEEEVEEGSDIDFNHLDENEKQNIEVSFLVAEIRQQQYHSLKTILLRLAQNTKLTNSQIADSVISNHQIGNVVLADDDSGEQQDGQQDQQDEQDGQQDDDELNVYSVLTVVPGNKKLSKQMKKFVSKISNKKISQQILQIINNTSTNIIINERLSNLPAFVVNHSHEVFKKDMLQLKKTNKEEYKKLFSGYLLNISQIQFQGQADLEKLIFSKFQDFQMCKRAKIWWLGDRNKSFKKKTDMRNLYYLIAGQQYLQGVSQIKTYLTQ